MKQEFYKSLLKKVKFIGMSEGSSMVPIIHPKDGLYVRPTSIRRLKINDIITFQQKNKIITHRVIYKSQNYIITKGDNNSQSDERIYPNQIVGKVNQIKRNEKVFNPNSLYLILSTIYLQEIVKIKQQFEKEKINYVFLKGLPLHLYFEKTHPRRIYADCDVLINKKDFQKAEEVVKKFGYKKANEKSKQVENNYFKIINDFPVVFDLHLEPAFLMTQFSGLEVLYPQKLIDQLTKELLNNKQRIKINNEPFLILNTKYLILFLALHFFHHNFRGTFRLDFLDKVIRKSHLSTKDWQNIALKIKKYRLQNFIYPSFKLLQKYYQSPISKSFLKTIKPSLISSLNLSSRIYHLGSMFDGESQIQAGINRFKLIFLLSPQPLWRKFTVFFHPQITYSIFWSLQKKLSSFFSNRKLIQSSPF